MESSKRIDGEHISLDDLFQKHKAFVHQQVNRHLVRAHKHGLDKDDVLGMAAEGFTKAYKRFDDKQEVKFLTYAKRLMAGEILRRIRDYGRMVTFTRSVKDLAGTITNHDLQDKTVEVISEQLDVPENRVMEALDYLIFTDDRLEEQASEVEGMTMEKHELYGVEDDHSAMDFYRFFETLTPQERKIVHLRLMDYPQREVGKEIGIGQMWVSRKLKRIKEKYEQYQKEGIA